VAAIRLSRLTGLRHGWDGESISGTRSHCSHVLVLRRDTEVFQDLRVGRSTVGVAASPTQPTRYGEPQENYEGS
jgi:hypothetical protein